MPLKCCAVGPKVQTSKDFHFTTLENQKIFIFEKLKRFNFSLKNDVKTEKHQKSCRSGDLWTRLFINRMISGGKHDV